MLLIGRGEAAVLCVGSRVGLAGWVRVSAVPLSDLTALRRQPVYMYLIDPPGLSGAGWSKATPEFDGTSAALSFYSCPAAQAQGVSAPAPGRRAWCRARDLCAWPWNATDVRP